jgi:hypothetical protein
MREPVTEFQGTADGPEAAAGSRVLPALILAIVVPGLALGCAKKQEPAAAEAAAAKPAGAAAHWTAEQGLETFDPSRFSSSTKIDNPWFPLSPGLRFTFEGSAVDEEGITIPLKMVLTTTDLTKTIGGVACVVNYDLDWKEGQLVEAENAFFAQDDSGSVWLMGEYPEEYDDGDGVVTLNPAWFHGLEGASAGILVPGRAELGSRSFSQGYSEAVDFTDRGMVDSLGVRTCVPADCYDDCIVIAEGSAGEMDVEQLKYYARGVGNVRVWSRGAKDVDKQRHMLVKVERIDAKELARVREAALKLEAGGFKRNKTYAQTAPLKGPGLAKR